MAPGTADQRFLVRPAKTTSAGILLALVVAALVLAGCGGGSSDSSSPETTTVGTSAGLSSDGSKSATAGGPSANGAGNGPGAGGASAGSAGGPTGSGAEAGASDGNAGKHGPRIAQPRGAPEPGITPQQRQEATVASMILQSPSSQSSGGGPQALPATYTCDGPGTSPALRWQGVPPGTAELVLLTMNIQPVAGKLFFDWAAAGLSPDLEEIEAGRLPKGAIVGRNSFGKAGYEICPESGAETYMFALFALPKKLSPAPGFDPSTLRKEVLDASGNVGLLALSYGRG